MLALTEYPNHRKIALGAGLFYILTFVSIPTLSLYAPIHQSGYVYSNENNRQVIIGGLLEIMVALSGIATAVILYPVLGRQNKSLALGLVASRVLEAATIFSGVAFLLTATFEAGVGAEMVRKTMVTLYDRIFLLGQGFIPAINDLLLGLLLYQSRLVPRVLSLIGILGAAPLIAGYLAVMFGLIEQRSVWAGLSALLVALFEFALGLYLVFKGFRQKLATEVHPSK